MSVVSQHKHKLRTKASEIFTVLWVDMGREELYFCLLGHIVRIFGLLGGKLRTLKTGMSNTMYLHHGSMCSITH